MNPLEHGLPASGAEKKIRRPPNGYIIFGREWRKKLATKYPTEGNTQISVRLGNMWHSLTGEEKQRYLDLGRHTAIEHRLRYPDYTYNPNEARIQKALRRAARDLKSMNARGHKATTAHRLTLKQVHSHNNPALLRMLAKGDIHTIPCLQSPNGDYVILMDGQQVLSYVPALEISSILSDSSGVGNGTDNTNSSVPAREQASVSTEIGYYSHAVPLSTTAKETENHQSASNEMLEKQDIHTSPCLQSTNHVSTPQSGDCMMLMDGQQLLSFLQAHALEITSILSDSCGIGNGTENTNRSVPAREQASVSTEIGCYSHEVLLSTTTEETENHQCASNEHNANKMRVGRYDLQREGDSVDMKTDGPRIASAYSLKAINLEQNTNRMKVERYDLQREGDSIDMKTDGPRIASAYSLKEIKLEQNFDEIKIKDSVDILREEDSIRIKSEEICTPSAFSVDENKPEISSNVVKVEPGLYNERCLASACDGYGATGTKVEQISDVEDDDEPVLVIYSSVKAECKQNANEMKVEKYDLQREGDLIDMKTNGPRIPSAFSVNEIKLEQNFDEIKIKDSVDILREENSIRIKSEEICTPSAFSVDEEKPEISTDVVKVGPALYNERCLTSSCDGYEATGTKVEQIIDIEDDDEPVLVMYSSVKAECKQNANKMKVEKYDLQREGDLIDMKTNGPRIASAYSLNEIKLEQSIDEIKIEDSVDILSEEDSIDIKGEDIYTPSAYSVDENELEISTDVVEVGPALYNEKCLASSCDGYEATGTKVGQISDIEDDDEPVLVIYSSVKADCKSTVNERRGVKRPHSCNTCSKSFRCNSDLLRHERIHSGERPYSCDICNKCFTTKSDLTRHKRTHNNERLYTYYV